MVREAGQRRHKRHIILFPAERETSFILLRRLFPSKTASLDFAGDPVIKRVLADTCEQKEKADLSVCFSFLVREAGLEGFSRNPW